MEWEYFTINLHDAWIIRLDRTPDVLTMHLDCSGVQDSQARNILQLQFFSYHIMEDADLTGCRWIDAWLWSKKPTSTAHTLELNAQSRKRRKFILRFQRMEIIREQAHPLSIPR